MSPRLIPDVPLTVDDDAAEETDGRRLRRDRNRQAVVDALLDLYADGNLRPSSAEIAERAGLSPRSLFRYFDDVDDLCRVAVDRQQRRALPLLDLSVGGTAAQSERIAALVAQRARLFEAVACAATVSRLEAPFQPLLAKELAHGRQVLRDQVQEVFTPELDNLRERGSEVLAAMDVLCSFEAYQLLRHDQGLSIGQATAVMRSAVEALLAASGDPS